MLGSIILFVIWNKSGSPELLFTSKALPLEAYTSGKMLRRRRSLGTEVSKERELKRHERECFELELDSNNNNTDDDKTGRRMRAPKHDLQICDPRRNPAETTEVAPKSGVITLNRRKVRRQDANVRLRNVKLVVRPPACSFVGRWLRASSIHLFCPRRNRYGRPRNYHFRGLVFSVGYHLVILGSCTRCSPCQKRKKNIQQGISQVVTVHFQAQCPT